MNGDTAMERKLKDGFADDSIKTVAGRLVPIVCGPLPRTSHKQAWFVDDAPDECWEAEETLEQKAMRILAEIRNLQDGGATVYVKVDDAPVNPRSNAPDLNLAGCCCKVTHTHGHALVACTTADGRCACVFASNLDILDTIPPEFAKEGLREKGKRVVAEIQAELDRAEYPFVRMAEVPVDFQGRPFPSDVAGLVGRVTATASDQSVCIQFPGSDGLRWPHNLEILTDDQVLAGLNTQTQETHDDGAS